MRGDLRAKLSQFCEFRRRIACFLHVFVFLTYLYKNMVITFVILDELSLSFAGIREYMCIMYFESLRAIEKEMRIFFILGRA